MAEAELGVGLGPVAGYDLGQGPVVAVGDQDLFAEDLGFEFRAGVGVDAPGQPVLGGGVAVRLPGDDAFGPGVGADAGDVAFYPGAVAAGLAAGQGGCEFVEVGACFGQGLVQAGGLLVCRVGEWVSTTRRSAP